MGWAGKSNKKVTQRRKLCPTNWLENAPNEEPSQLYKKFRLIFVQICFGITGICHQREQIFHSFSKSFNLFLMFFYQLFKDLVYEGGKKNFLDFLRIRFLRFLIACSLYWLLQFPFHFQKVLIFFSCFFFQLFMDLVNEGGK